MVSSLSTTYPLKSSVFACVAPGVLSWLQRGVRRDAFGNTHTVPLAVGARGTVFHINLEMNF